MSEIEQNAWKQAIDQTIIQAISTHRLSVVLIGTTARLHNPPFIIGPSKESCNFISCSFIIDSDRHLREICQYADGKVDYVFVDAESKIPGSSSFVSLAAALLKKSRMNTYKANDMTVIACDLLIGQLVPNLSNKKIAIIGAGNIGSKTALVLAERGAQVHIFRRDGQSRMIADALNMIKNKYSSGKLIGAGTIEEAVQGADVLIGFTPGIPVITKNLAERLKGNSLVIDGGIGTIAADAIAYANAVGITLFRLDVRIALPYIIDSILDAEAFSKKTAGKRTYNGQNYVAGGVIGNQGDTVVHSIQDLSGIIGIADGKGGIIRT